MTCAPAWHLEHVLGQRRSDRGEPRVARGAHGDAVGLTDDVVVGEHAGVGVELAALREGDEMATALRVDQERAVARARTDGPSQRTGPAMGAGSRPGC